MARVPEGLFRRKRFSNRLPKREGRCHSRSEEELSGHSNCQRDIFNLFKIRLDCLTEQGSLGLLAQLLTL